MRQNPWQQYFHDQEVRATIEQDVMRTYPELEFFQGEAVQTDLTNILFCYSRRHDEIGYRQGMHELLANIYLVLHRDALFDSEQLTGADQLSPEDRCADNAWICCR